MGANPNDHRPAYQQVAEVIRCDIDSGALAPGAQLPPVRELMATHGRAQGTIDKALALLRSEGRVVSHPGSGVFVRDPSHPVPGTEPAVHDQLADLRRELTDVQRRLEVLEDRLT